MTIEFRGPNFPRSRSGWAPDALKSGLQKYLRRGDWQAAGRCAWEMLEFSAVAVTAAERTTGRALRTNLLNRTLISAAEDVGIADPVRMARAMRIVLRLQDTPRAEAREELGELLVALQLLAGSRKIRSVSLRRSMLVKVPAKFPELAARLRESGVAAGLTPEEVAALDAELATNATGRIVPGAALVNGPAEREKLDDTILTLLCGQVADEIAEQALVVYEHLLGGRWAVIPAAMRMFEVASAATAARRREVARVFWAVLRSVATATSPAEAVPEILAVLDVLEAAHGRTREADVYVITALELFLEYGPAEWQDAIVVAPSVAESAMAEAEAIASCPERLELDGFVLDMHTRVGRAAGRSAVDFLIEGSVVIPERTMGLRPIAKTLYTAFKLFGETDGTRANVAGLDGLGADERRRVSALLDLMGMEGPVPPPPGRSRADGRRREAASGAPVPVVVTAPEPVADYTSADFEVLGTLIGCIGGKKPLLRKVRMHDGRIWLLKPVKDGFYLWVDAQKPRYGIEPIGMELVRVDGALAVRMRFVEGAVNLSRLARNGGRAWYEDAVVRRDYLKIAMFRVGLRVSDTSPYNTLARPGVDGRPRLVSIDEMATTDRHDTPRILGGPRAAAVMRDADFDWAHEVVESWERLAGGPIDYAYLRDVFRTLLSWTL